MTLFQDAVERTKIAYMVLHIPILDHQMEGDMSPSQELYTLDSKCLLESYMFLLGELPVI